MAPGQSDSDRNFRCPKARYAEPTLPRASIDSQDNDEDDEQDFASTEEAANRRDCLGLEELHIALGVLSPLDLKRLKYAAAMLTKGTEMTADDLVGEAVQAALVGRRHCPRDVPVAVFMKGVMKSLASSVKKAATRSKIVPSRAASAEETSTIEQSPDPHPDPEQTLIEREDEAEAERNAVAAKTAVQVLNAHFSDDYEVQLCILGIMDGQVGKEFRDFVGVDQAGLDHAKKKIRRANHKLFPGGWRNVQL